MKVMSKIAANAALIGVLVSISARAAERRVPVPHPVLFMYGYSDATTVSSSVWGTLDQYRALWEKTMGTFTVADGITKDADLVNRLRSQGKVFAYHVSNTIDEKHKTAEDFVSAWSEPFENTLEGKLPGGFDAISIDEFHSYPDGSKESQLQNESLRQLRKRFPDRLIFVSGVWKLADGGPGALHSDKKVTYDDTLNALQKYADVFVLENYQRTGNIQFEFFESMPKNLESRSPGLLGKTIFALYISQSAPFIGDDDPRINFFDFLEKQINLVKTGKLTSQTPGIGYWVFYRSKPETIERILDLTQKYFQ